jgi:hypothetical protein
VDPATVSDLSQRWLAFHLPDWLPDVVARYDLTPPRMIDKGS